MTLKTDPLWTPARAICGCGTPVTSDPRLGWRHDCPPSPMRVGGESTSHAPYDLRDVVSG